MENERRKVVEEMAQEQTRVGVVGIVVEDLSRAKDVNEVLHMFSDVIVGRMGIPYKEKGISVISLIVDGTIDRISAMTGKLGRVPGITVKSAVTKR
ncbi:MAG: TM1266 family iron-only hydrogenase system putative regulator [Cellulosilyticaceae bacterium]